MKKLAVLTSGGDAPGMNACLRAVVRYGEVKGYQVIGVMGGYQGLIDGDFKKLSLEDVEGIVAQSGTVIKTSRCPAFMTPDGFDRAVKNARNQNFDAVVVLGGDGSLNGALKLSKEGINVIGVPCTIDNDMGYTDFTIGFDTAINTVTSLLGNIRDTVSSHDRACVVEVMGRHSGEIALNAGIASGAELVIVPEVKLPDEEICKKIKTSVESGEKCILVVVAEGAATADAVAKMIKEKLNLDVKSVVFGYIQRGGSPSANDRILATRMGAYAVELATQKKFGVAVSSLQNKMVAVPLVKAIIPKSKFDKNLYFINNDLSI